MQLLPTGFLSCAGGIARALRFVLILLITRGKLWDISPNRVGVFTLMQNGTQTHRQQNETTSN